MIIVHVRIEARPGERDNLLAGANEMAVRSREETGCLTYHFYEDTEDGTFAFFEQYVDDAAFEAHRRAPHFLAWREQMQDLIASREARMFQVEASSAL